VYFGINIQGIDEKVRKIALREEILAVLAFNLFVTCSNIIFLSLYIKSSVEYNKVVAY